MDGERQSGQDVRSSNGARADRTNERTIDPSVNFPTRRAISRSPRARRRTPSDAPLPPLHPRPSQSWRSRRSRTSLRRRSAPSGSIRCSWTTSATSRSRTTARRSSSSSRLSTTRRRRVSLPPRSLRARVLPLVVRVFVIRAIGTNRYASRSSARPAGRAAARSRAPRDRARVPSSTFGSLAASSSRPPREGHLFFISRPDLTGSLPRLPRPSLRVFLPRAVPSRPTDPRRARGAPGPRGWRRDHVRRHPRRRAAEARERSREKQDPPDVHHQRLPPRDARGCEIHRV